MSFRKTHGLTGTPVYQSWAAMMTRCYNNKCPTFVDYGGSGRVACEFIRASPANLLILIGQRPDRHSLDRANNKGNYSCGACAECLTKGWALNVRWATKTTQNRNQEIGNWVTIGGVTKCAAEWAEQAGVPYRTFVSRLRYGWSEDRLLSPLVRHRTALLTIGEDTKSVPDWSRSSGIGISAIRSRFRRGLRGHDLIQPLQPRGNFTPRKCH